MLRLVRYAFQADGILGHLYDADYQQLACTLEHSYDGKPKLPAGTYQCVRGKHTLAGRPEPFETFEVMGVPGHTGILFHPGNWQGDSNGCILVGRTVSGSDHGCMVTNSRATFYRFMLDLDGMESFMLVVEDGVTV